MLWEQTITLYNKHEDEQTGAVRWYRHKLNKCFFKNTNTKANIGGVQIKTDDSVVRIPVQSKYLPPHKWLNIPNDEKPTKLTLQPGDLIFFGDVSEEIDEYTSGKRSSDLIAKYKTLGSLYITSVNINDWMYGQHYFVKGE